MAKSKKKSNIIFTIIIIACIAVAAFSVFMIVKSNLEYKHIDDVNNQVVDTIIKSNDDKKDSDGKNEGSESFTFDFNAAKNINSDTLGLLYIPSLDSKLPIVSGRDNDYYLHHAFDGSSSIGGTVFEEAGIKDGMDASHILLYGHYMKNGSMFGSHKEYKSADFYKTGNNDTFYIYTENSIKTYKIFSVHNTPPDSDVYTFNFSSVPYMLEYAKRWQSESIYDTGVDISNTTQIVTLSSCEETDYNERFVIQGALVSETPVSGGTVTIQ